MPSRDLHMYMDFHFLDAPIGSTAYIHDLLDHGTAVDIDYQQIWGVTHRHFMHDVKGVQWIEANYGPYAALVARLHISLDLVWSKGKRDLHSRRW